MGGAIDNRRVTRVLSGNDEIVVLGLSGGIDSVVLAHLLFDIGVNVVAAHVNYRLRGSESDADERFARRFSKELGFDFRVLRVEPEGRDASSLQAWARHVRYRFFEQVATEVGSTSIVVAHHDDDQAETILLNMMRGTGIDGLGGMRLERSIRWGAEVRVVRPLLSTPRAQIMDYAREHGLSWREDSSNKSLRYRRTFARKLFRAEDAPVDRARLSDIGRRAAHVGDVLLPEALPDELPRPSGVSGLPRVDVPLDALNSLPNAVAGWYVNRLMGRLYQDAPRRRTIITEILSLTRCQPGKKVLLDGISVWRLRDRLRFQIRDARSDPVSAAFTLGESVLLPSGQLLSSILDRSDICKLKTDSHTALVDAGSLTETLTLRPWQPADRLYPLGMTGSKKVSDILTDRKVPSSERSHSYVLCSGSQIIWVIGADQDRRFRVRDDSSTIARFQFLLF